MKLLILTKVSGRVTPAMSLVHSQFPMMATSISFNSIMSTSPSKYSARNVYYVRISPSGAMRLLLLLDRSHIHWMDDDKFRRVLEVLKPRLLPKLNKESENLGTGVGSKGKIDVYRGAGYQMAYFFRKVCNASRGDLKEMN
jgi:hypothetical protein